MPNPNNPLAPGLNGAAPKGPRTIWNNPVFSAVLAIIMGFAMWIIVTVYIDPQGSTTVTGVPINYTSGASTYTAQGLDIVEKPDIEGVTVKVEGNSTIIGNIRSADIMVYPSYAGVSGAGKVTLRLQARVTNTTDFPGDIECTVESPSTIDVVFDEVSEKTVPVTVDASAVTISSGYMLNKTTAVPAEITLRGPTSELDQVSSIVAPVQMDGELADTTTVPATLELRDEEGNAFTPQYISMESDSANVTLTVYQVRELPLEVDFIGTPNGFDVESLHYSLSQQTLRVAGPARTISALEVLTVTDFDLAREFEPGRDYQRLIELPAGIVSLDGVTNVTLDFDTSEMTSTKLNVSNIRAINVPSNYELQILSSIVAPVQIDGELADTTTVPATLQLRDEVGNVFTPQYISMESDSANVTLTVYQVRELPLKVDFIGTPNGFDVESLHYSLSQQTLRVAGPARTISTLESLTVTDFDLAREFEPGRDYQRLIELPAGIVSLDGVTNVTLDFDTSEMGSTKLNVSNIRAINVPSNYELQILSSLVSGVTLYGPADEIEKLNADSIVAQIDCQSLNLTVGQQTIAVSIQIPSATRIFATGSYTVQCEVTSK